MGRKSVNDGFKPFVVASEASETVFRVLEIDDNISKEAVTRILEKLPIRFSICKEGCAEDFDGINEPLEIKASSQLFYVYPPKHRMISCTHAWNSRADDGLIRKMNFDNIIDMENPGHEQIRTCIHFDPKIFGVSGAADEIEIDIHVYPESKIKESKIDAPHVSVEELLSLIAGGEEKELTAEHVEQWEDLIMYAVKRMRYAYESQDKDYDPRKYFEPCWERIDNAGKDYEKIAVALENLRSAIKWK